MLKVFSTLLPDDSFVYLSHSVKISACRTQRERKREWCFYLYFLML